MASHSYSSSREHEYVVKTVLIGDLGVGKTTFLHTYMAGKFSRSKAYPDIHEVKERLLMKDNKHIRLQLWDTAGQEKYRSLTASYYRNAHGCIILFDVGNAETFANVYRWLDDIKSYASQKEMAIVLVGTKCHVPDNVREVPKDQAESFAKEHEIPYLEVSAECDIDSVYRVCDTLIEEVMDKLSRYRSTPSLSRVEVKKLNQKRKRTWCSC